VRHDPLKAILGVNPPQIQTQHVVDKSPQRTDVREFAVPKSREILDDVMDHLRFRHLLVRIAPVCASGGKLGIIIEDRMEEIRFVRHIWRSDGATLFKDVGSRF